jgi:hypothetical protein
MLMGTVVSTGGAIVSLYKHHETRKYLNLDEAGHAYRYTKAGTYTPVELLAAVDHALSW